MSNGTAMNGSQGQDQGMDLLRYSFNAWGLFSLCLPLLPLLMLLAYGVVDDALWPVVSLRVGGPVSLIATLVIAFFAYTLRDDLHRYTHTRSFSERPRRSLPDWALRAFVSALALSFVLAFAVAAEDMLVARGPFEPGLVVYGSGALLLLRLSMTAVMVLAFVCYALLAGLMAAYAYGEAVDRSDRDRPLYADEARLQRKVLQAARSQLDLGAVSVAEMSRRLDGGLCLILQRKGELIERGDEFYREDRTWQVEANYEGELIRVDEQEVRHSKAEGLEVDLVLSEVREVLDTTGPLTVAGMRRKEDGGARLIVVHRGTRWVAEVDRWSRLIEIQLEST
ncbi:MAG: hypothetical protein ACK2VD_14125 [Anaerolineae bacterium]|jgi:hypothetical protein